MIGSPTLRPERTHYRSYAVPTPFHARTTASTRTNEWSRWAGYTTPLTYTNLELEYFAARNTATVMDLSPMIKYRVAGRDAEAYLNRLVTRDVRRLKPGRVAYVVWCNDSGMVLDDGTLFRFGAQEFRLCAQDRHLPWLLDSAIGYDVEITDVTEGVAALAVQGPTSCAVLKRLGLEGVERLRPFALAEFPFEDGVVEVSRTGYTGDLGYELWLRPSHAEALWDRLVQAGGLHGLRPMGTGALDLLRIEAGYLLPHTDFMPFDEAVRATRGRTPDELGLEWLVDLGKGHFNGRRALVALRRRGARYRVVRLDIEGNKSARDAFVYHDRNREAGHITSAMWSPTCKRNIALATLKTEYLVHADNLWAEIYVSKELKWEKRMARVRIVEGPFFNPPRRWATPAGDF